MNDSTVEVREVFLGFVEAESTKAVALAERFLTTQAEFGNEPVRCVHKARTVRQMWYGGVKRAVYQKQCTSI